MTPVPLNDLQRQMLVRLVRDKGLPATEAAIGEVAAQLLGAVLIDRHDRIVRMAALKRAAEQSRG